MPRTNTIDTNFTSGEISPLMRGRVDTTKYQNGAELLENFIVRPQGGLWKRSGTRYVNSTKFSSTKSRLVKFEFSDQQAYVMEFGVGYIRFFKDGYPLMETSTEKLDDVNLVNNGGAMQFYFVDMASDLASFSISDVANSGGLYQITTTRPHTLRTGQIVHITGTGTTADNLQWTITRTGFYTLTLQGSTFGSTSSTGSLLTHGVMAGDIINVTGSGGTLLSYLSGWKRVQSVESQREFTFANLPYAAGTFTGEDIYTIPIEVLTDYTEADLEDLEFAQSADVIYICHPSHPPAKLSRLSDDGNRNDWLLADINFQDGPYLPLNSIPPNLDSTTPANGAVYPDVYLTITNYTHTATATATVGSFDTGDDNKYIEFREGDQWRLALLPGTINTSDTSATVTILDNVLLFLDETVKLTGKKRKRQNQGNYPFGYLKTGQTVGWNSDTMSYAAPGAGQQYRIDPNNEIQQDSTTSTLLTSQFASTFGNADIGKYIRFHLNNTATPAWALIEKVPQEQNGSKVVVGSPLSMATIGHTGEFVITNETRSCTVTARRNNSTYALFNSNDVGRMIRLGYSGRWTWGKISAYTSTSQVTVTLYEDIPRDPHNAANIAGGGRTYTWRLGAWATVGANNKLGPGYPSVVCFHEQRLCFASTQAEPQTVWMSASGDFENFLPTELDSTVADDNAVTYTLAATKVQPIVWMESGATLLIGTVSGEWQAKSSAATQEPISPRNIMVVQHVSHGSLSTTGSQRIGYSTLFCSRSGNKIRELVYDFGLDTFVAKDLTIIAEHILRQGGYAYRTAYQQEPHSLYWVVLNDGTLAALTFEKDQEVYAWHRHDVGGIVESICVIPSADGQYDQLWMVVKRTIDGATARYVERLEADFYPDSASDNDDMFFVDSGATITTATALATLGGLHHLEGETVEILYDGTRANTAVVNNGSVTAPAEATTYQVGLPFTAKVRSMPPEGGSAFGASAGAKKVIKKLRLRFLDSIAVEYGWHGTGGALDEVNFTPTTLLLTTGTHELNIDSPFDTEGQYTLQSSKPYPLNILSVTKVMECHE